MRLINTASLQFEEHLDEENLSYAILSHRWEDGEVSFEDWKNVNVAWSDLPLLQRTLVKSAMPTALLKGFTKIVEFCRRAAGDGFVLAWVDTCCIDKRSSAELSEAINSMYRWYRNAGTCYAYLSDVDSFDGLQMCDSIWFTRGWTLQELLAPAHLVFFNKSWGNLGTKTKWLKEVSRVTRIPVRALAGDAMSTFTIGERMQWASRRSTSRIEDRAYCLLGLFDVNMPMLYGEGKKAFVRLQEEIIRFSEDQTIFAWSGVGERPSGLLAESSSQFSDFPRDIYLYEGATADQGSFSMTQRGLTIKLNLAVWTPDIYLALLDGMAVRNSHGIFLRRLEDGTFARVSVTENLDF